MAEAVVLVNHPSGLHARPLAAFVKLAKSFDADVQVENLSTGKGPASGKSAVHLLLLTAKQGHELRITTGGPQGDAALEALTALVANNFGEGEAS